MNIHDSVVSQDGALKATLAAFDSKTGKGLLKIEELKAERGRFYVTVTYGEGRVARPLPGSPPLPRVPRSSRFSKGGAVRQAMRLSSALGH